MSSFFKKTVKDKQVIHRCIENNFETSSKKSRTISIRLNENFKKLNCQTIPLSYFIKQENIPRIDIIEGIKKRKLEKERNIIIESHT